MKICLAQIKSFPGDIAANIAHHGHWIKLAGARAFDLIVFPELSLTGYEPTLVQEIALRSDDPRLDIFQQWSDNYQLRIAIGAPLRMGDGIRISLVIFHPARKKQIYFKTYLHADELPFFISGPNRQVTLEGYPALALAICYEISVPEHIDRAAAAGVGFYLASVVKFTSGMEKAAGRLSEIARTYGLTVMMANAVGEADGGICGGNSGIWNKNGNLQGRLDASEEGLITFDTSSEEITQLRYNE